MHSRLNMKILIVDDHPALREGVAALLGQVAPQTSVLQASAVDEALSLIDSHQDLDVVVLDLMLPGPGGMQAISEVGRMRPDLPIIVLSSSEDVRDVRRALTLGALGYVPKSASNTTLLSAVRLVLDGDIYVPPLVLNEANDRAAEQTAPGESDTRLTQRQVEILALLSEGRPNKTIARLLGMSEKTVKGHITAIFKALNVVNRTQAAAVGRSTGLL